MKSKILFLLTIISLQAYSQNAYICDSSNYKTLFNQMKAGDTLTFTPGNYKTGLTISNKMGSPNSWFVLKSQITHQAVFTGRNGSNTIDISNSQFVKINGFKFDGQNIPNIDAIKAGGDTTKWTANIWLDDNLIVGHGGTQQTCGISTKINSWDWKISNNIIDQAGTGIYLGNSDGSAPFVRGLIEKNLIINPLGYCMQIKHQLSYYNIPDDPKGNFSTIIRHNVFIKDARTSPDGDRPNLLIGGQIPVGKGLQYKVEIYGNFLYNNPREYLFQGTGALSLHNNIFMNSQLGAINITKQNNIEPRKINLYNNTIVTQGKGIRIYSADKSYTQTVIGNAVFADTPYAYSIKASDLTGTLDEADKYFTALVLNSAIADLTPKPAAKADSLDLLQFCNDLEWYRDFNGYFQDGEYYGAYSKPAPNEGWKLWTDRKTYTPELRPVDWKKYFTLNPEEGTKFVIDNSATQPGSVPVFNITPMDISLLSFIDNSKITNLLIKSDSNKSYQISSNNNRQPDGGALYLPDGRIRFLGEEPSPTSTQTKHKSRIVSSISDDGINWTREPGIRYIPGPDDDSISSVVSVIQIQDATWRMYYVGDFYNTNGIRTALTSDWGMTWKAESKTNILDKGDVDPHPVYLSNGKIRLYFRSGMGKPKEVSGISYCDSDDGLRFNINKKVLLISDTATIDYFKLDPAVIKYPNGSVQCFMGAINSQNQQATPLLLMARSVINTATPEISENEILITPNPANEFIKLQGTYGTNVTIKIYNSLGIEILNTSDVQQISLLGFAPGIYFCRIKSDDFNITKKIILVH